MPLPVFVVAVDVNQRKAYFTFAQGQIDNTLALRQSIQRGGVTTFRVPLANTLTDIPLLLREVDSAWKFMREKFPGSLEAAAEFRRRVLEGLDPRFDYEISLVDGAEHVALHPKEPVKCVMTVKGDGEAAAAKLKKLIGEGEPLLADGELTI